MWDGNEIRLHNQKFNILQNQNHFKKNENKNNSINVRFNCNNGKRYIIIANKDELLSSLFVKFRNRIKDYKNDYHFVHNCKPLNSDCKLGELYSYESIFEIDASLINENSGGILSLNFTDLSKQIHEDHYFSEEAPSYRLVSKGINIYGICKFKKCKAYEQEVIVPLEGSNRLDLIKDKDNLECPECGGLVIPKTIGFYLCKYNINGTKFESGKGVPFSFSGIAKNRDSVQYYSPDKNGETTIVELVVEITEFL